MSAPSPPPSPQRRPLHQRSDSGNNRLQIRVVPYSPPHPTSDAGSTRLSASSRPVSYDFTSSSPIAASPESHYQPYDDEPNIVRCFPTEASRDQSQPSSSLTAHASGAKGWPSHVETTPGLSSPIEPASPSAGRDFNHAPNRRSRLSQASPETSGSPASWRSPSPFRGSRNVININPDKTFSLVPQAGSASSRTSAPRSPNHSYITPSSSYGRSSDAYTNDALTSSPLTPLAERPSKAYSPASSFTTHSEAASPCLSAPMSASPWNYRLAGGVRKVPETPDRKISRRQSAASSTSSESLLPPLPELPDTSYSTSAPRPAVPLAAKPSVQSMQSGSTLSDRTNYKVYAQSSPVRAGHQDVASSAYPDLESLPPSSSHSNYRVLGESSSSNQSIGNDTRPQTGESNVNVIVHRGPSASPSTIATGKSRMRQQFSQESLVVAPLRPVRKKSREHFAIAKSRSRESLRRGSLSSLSSVITQEATRALFAGAATINVPASIQRHNVWGVPSGHSSQHPQMIPSYPHQWSSQLSTVVSESEGGSLCPTRSMSPLSSSVRNSSGFNTSSYSKRMMSISSSLGGLDEAANLPNRSHREASEPLLPTPPPAASHEPNPASRTNLIWDYDEDGDGLGELHDLHHRPSRTRMAAYLSSYPSDRNLRSAGSSRTNSLKSSIPLWARVYYGSGERRFLLTRPSNESMFTDYTESRPGSSFMNRSPSMERFTTAIFSPRRRPREVSAATAPLSRSTTTTTVNTASLSSPNIRSQTRESAPPSREIRQHPLKNVRRPMRKQTSSLWSPHLRSDKRSSGYSIWDPPSAVWSAEGGLTSRRNLQVELFIAGFLFPFAWMIASFLPLPHNPQFDMVERLRSTSHLDLHNETAASHHMHAIHETRYLSAKWWRTLNRGMSIVGLIVIGVAIALIVVGVRQKWGK